MESPSGTPGWVSEARRLAEAADPGPWHASRADDDHCAVAFYVARGDFKRGRWPSPEQVVAVTFLQYPCLAVSDLAESNTALIAASRDLVLRLCTEVERLREQRARAAHTMRLVSSTLESAPTEHARRLLEVIQPLVKELDSD